VDRDHGVPAVVAAAEQARLLELGEPRLEGGALGAQLVPDRGILGRQLRELLEVLGLRLQCTKGLDSPACRGVLRRYPRRALLVVPEAGRRHLALERRYSLLEYGWVKGSPRAA
jgi:hypothetical protein